MKNSENKKLRNDIILAAALLLSALVAFLIFHFSAERGSAARITLDGETYALLPLDTDTVIEIKSGENEEYINFITVKDGEIFVSEANCPDGICSEHRPIKNSGETIVCLPHKVVVTVEGEGSGEVDTVS